ncbi:MAG: hypothetical protein ACQEQM_04470 [Thermoplasmatota archaeon]
MLKRNRLMAVFIVLLMVFSVFTMLAKPTEGAAVSDEELTSDPEYGWLNAVEINGDFSDVDDEPEEDVFVGQKEISMRPYFNENVTEQPLDSANITHSEVDTENIDRLVGDDWESNNSADWINGSNNFEWITDTIYTNTGEFSGVEEFAGNFEFDIPNEATPGIYRIPIMMQIENYSSATDQWYGSHENWEYVWLELAGNTEVEDRTLEPGIEFANRPITVANVGNSDLEDVSLMLDESDLVDEEGTEVTIHNPDDTSYVDYISQGWSNQFNFRFTVPFEMEPGEYEVDYEITATREEDDEIITEHGTVTITISRIAELSAEIVENEINQGTPKQEFTVTFTNTGNLDLERISVEPVDEFPFSVPSEYYEHSTATTDDPMVDIGDLEVGESTDIDIILGIDQNIQIGQHKLFFDYEGFYFDSEGEVTGSEGFYEVDDLGLVADTDEPYAWIEVTEPDVALDVGAYDLDSVRVTDMGYQTVSITLVNNGYVDFTDAEIMLDTTDTPFINPSDPQQDTIEMLDESFTLYAGSSRQVNFGVMIDTEFIEQRLVDDRPIYTADLTMNALNGDTLNESEMSLSTDGEVLGVGPQLSISGDIDDNTVVAGEEFELTYTIENKGDEPIRSLNVRLSPNVPNVDIESFDSAQDAIYFWQAGSSPASTVWNVEPEDTVLYPGESTTVTFNMVSSSDMQEGAIYHVDLEVGGTADQTWQTTATLRTEEDSSTKPILSTQLSYILVAIIIGVFFALGVFIYKRDKKSKAEKEELEQEPEYEEEEYTHEEIEEEEIEPEPATESEWEEEEPPAPPEDEIFEEDESQIEPGEREEW